MFKQISDVDNQFRTGNRFDEIDVGPLDVLSLRVVILTLS